jgi:hypothetical protein
MVRGCASQAKNAAFAWPGDKKGKQQAQTRQMNAKVRNLHIVARNRGVAHTNTRQSVAQALRVDAVTDSCQEWCVPIAEGGLRVA